MLINNGEVIGIKSWEAKGKKYIILYISYTDRDTKGKACGFAFVNKEYNIGQKVDIIIIDNKLHVLEK